MTFKIAPRSARSPPVRSSRLRGAVGVRDQRLPSFLPLIVVLLVITPRNSTTPEAETDGAVSDGLEWIRARPAAIAVLGATLVVGWMSDPFSTLMPALAEDLGGGDVTVGLLVGQLRVRSGGHGAALRSHPRRRRTGASIGLGLALVAAGLAGTVLGPVTAVSMLTAATTGSGFLLGVTGTNAELQRAVPERLRGRVMAWWSVAFLGCRPIAAVVDGAIADLASVRISLGVAAQRSLRRLACSAGATGWCWMRRPRPKLRPNGRIGPCRGPRRTRRG